MNGIIIAESQGQLDKLSSFCKQDFSNHDTCHSGNNTSKLKPIYEGQVPKGEAGRMSGRWL